MDNFSENMNMLKNNSLFWSRAGFYVDPITECGKCPEMLIEKEKGIKYHKQAADAGIKIHTSVLFSGWIGVNKYDYTLTDETLDMIMSVSDEILYMPRIKLNVPLDWCEKYPEEVFVYENGPVDPEEIRNLVGTKLQDLNGVLPNTVSIKPEESNNLNGEYKISLQSFASPQWLNDAGEALRRVISHIENGKYGDRIVGYHIAYGLCGETVLWGRPTCKVGDYGICAKREFYKWGISKYITKSALEKAWQQSDLSESNIVIPSKAEREERTANYTDFYRLNDSDVICIDYDKFVSDINVNAMEHFGKIAKECSNNKPIGYFYGYLFIADNPAYTGHLGFDRALESPYIDFFSAPKGYHKKRVGESGGSALPVQSVLRKKYWIEELDNQTHLINYNYSLCKDFNDSRSVMWREACKNISYGSNFWWMDLYKGAFDSEELLAEMSAIEDFAAEIRGKKSESISEIIVVVDENFYYNARKSFEFQYLCWETMRQIALCGAPVDIYRLSDLNEIPLDRYKFFAFLTPQSLTMDKYNDIIKRADKNAVFFWYGVPGIIHEKNSSINICGVKFSNTDLPLINGLTLNSTDNVKFGEVFNAFECFPDDKNFIKIVKEKYKFDFGTLPMFKINKDDNMKILAYYKDGSVAAIENNYNGHKNICFTVASLNAYQWRELIEDAGVFMYSPAGTCVYANSSFVSVFNNAPVKDILHFPTECSSICLQNNIEYTNVAEIPLDMPEHSAFVFKFRNHEIQ